MIKIDGIEKHRNIIFKIADYLYSGLLTLGIVFVLIAIWKFGSIKFGEFMLPSPESVFIKAYELLGDIRGNEIDITFYRFIIGVVVSVVSGVALGLIAGYFKTARAVLKPIITILLSMPPIIWIVMALFWFGFGNSSTLFTIIITTTPLTFSNAMMGMMTVSPELEEVFDAYKLGVIKKIKYLYIPHLISYIIASLSIAVSMAVKITIMAELLGANNGIGARIADARVMLDTVDVLAFVSIILSFTALVEYLIIKPLEISLMPWRR